LFLLNDYPEVNLETDYTMSEFFILYKYRKQGIGKYCVNYLFKKHKGKWQVTFHPKNKISKSFWINVIKEYTNGKYKIYKNLDEVKNESPFPSEGRTSPSKGRTFPPKGKTLSHKGIDISHINDVSFFK
jgi:hypothetical protein